MALFRRKPFRADGPVELPLPVVVRRFAWAAAHLAGREIEPDLVRARLADHYRDAGLEPIAPDQFDKLVQPLDAEAWRRLALAITALEDEPVRRLLAPLSGRRDVAAQVRDGFVQLARETQVLSMDVLRQSELRIEEFARRFAAQMGLAIRGETEEESSARLHRIDYARLLAEAEQARDSAEEQMEYLRQLQEEEEQKRRPRGKW